ncbi:MAG: hypothetical protein Ct9H300mP9_3800 [Candidatus Neomarinimicrobiota bacterium]|nr:MAG: hypothetical protein Ct9H300mP9_3800 [Candidatus Neomarinimicrobiota bacterium]
MRPLTDKIQYNSSNIYYLDQQGKILFIFPQIEDVRPKKKLDFKFTGVRMSYDYRATLYLIISVSGEP